MKRGSEGRERETYITSDQFVVGEGMEREAFGEKARRGREGGLGGEVIVARVEREID